MSPVANIVYNNQQAQCHWVVVVAAGTHSQFSEFLLGVFNIHSPFSILRGAIGRLAPFSWNWVVRCGQWTMGNTHSHSVELGGQHSCHSWCTCWVLVSTHSQWNWVVDIYYLLSVSVSKVSVKLGGQATLILSVIGWFVPNLM